MKALRIVFALLLVGAVCVLGLRARNGVETDLYGLADARAGGVLGEIASSLGGQGRILLEGTDFDALKMVAEHFREMNLVGDIGRVGSPSRPPGDAPRTARSAVPTKAMDDVKNVLHFLDRHKAGLLTHETREQLLAGKYLEVATGAMVRLFSPVPRLLSVKDDPFLLATEYVTALQTGLAGDWTMRDGFPVCEREGRIFLLQTLDLTGVPAAKLADLVERCARDAAPFGSGVKVWCGGAPFHSAVASERSKSEISLLSGISLVCVLLLGWVLFRSFRFLPALIFAQGVGFLVATAALYLFFPKPHVLTFVFGTSLIGLSVDYVYHARIAGDVRRILRPLTLSLLTTVICFAPLLFAEVVVLRQMALFSIMGLIASYAAVSLWPSQRDMVGSALRTDRGACADELVDRPTTPDGPHGVRSLPRSQGIRILFGVVMGVALSGLFRVKVVDDPATFYRPNAYLTASERLIAELSPGQAQRFAFVRGATLQEALEREEALGVKGLSAVIPSLKRQRENAALIARLIQAEGSNYTAKTGLKMPHIPSSAFLDPEKLEEGPLLQMVNTMRVGSGLISPLPKDAVAPAGAEVLEPRAALQGLFRHFTSATLKLLAASFVAFMLVLALVFRRRMLRYLLPIVLSLGATAGALGWLNVPLTFFTMLCFFMLAGLGIDYVIFQMSDSSAVTRRTVFFAFLTSFVGLGSLALTGFPVTRSMGIAFAFGLFFAWLSARCLAQGHVAVCGPHGVRSLPNAQSSCGALVGSALRADRDACVGTDVAWHEQGEQSAGRWRMQFMWFMYAWFGKSTQKLVTIPVMLFIYPFARPAKRALHAFYQILSEFELVGSALRADRGPYGVRSLPGRQPPTAWHLFRHMLGFAWSLADKTDACTLKKNLPTMSVRDDAGWRAFRALVSERKGAFLISTHVGTIEVLPALAAKNASNSSIPHVHAFQQMGHDAVFTRMFMKHFDARALTLHAVEDIGVETAVQMQEAIGRGELVLMAGDRVSAGSGKTLVHDFLGRPCRWPKGVFAFAKLMEAPVFFVTCVRTGWNAYECHFRLFEGDLSTTRLLDQYVDFLQAETLEHPEQWYQFYDFFGNVTESQVKLFSDLVRSLFHYFGKSQLTKRIGGI